MAYEEIKVKKPLGLIVLPILSVSAFFIVWELIVDLGIVPDTMLAAPSTVIKLFIVKLTDPNPDGAVIGVHAWVSAQEAFIGYILSLAIGLPLGLFMGWFTVVRGLARPIFELIRPIPPIAWIPLTVFWFGIGLEGKVFIIWLGGVVPCVINAFVGVRMTNPTLIQMARTYGATNWQIFKQLCIPSAMPMVFGALQIALACCWVNLVGAELLASDQGLGFLITMGRSLGLPEMVVLGMVAVGFVGAVIGYAIDRVERRLLAGIRR
ncbi:MAG: ABC transporter permease [Deltaproteobacteria bacterium]|nr:ABC transporter permease [Deltaproteobacteria bacterium]